MATTTPRIKYHVKRVHDDNGSHIEPPMDNNWPDIDKLRWWAAVAEADTGKDLVVEHAHLQRRTTNWRGVEKWEPVPGEYAVLHDGHYATTGNYHHTWTWINGFVAGAGGR